MGNVIHLPLGELYMELHNREKLKTLMVIRGVSARKLAEEAGWKSHSYMNRLLNGEVNTLSTDPALRIAAFFEVGVDALFVPRVERSPGQRVKRPKTKRPGQPRRAAQRENAA